MRYFNNPDALIRLVLSMQNGLVATLTIFASTLLFSLPLGLLVALLRMNRHQGRQRAGVAVHPGDARHAADAADLCHLLRHSHVDGHEP